MSSELVRRVGAWKIFGGACAFSMIVACPARAQTAPAARPDSANSLEEIIVTARKRDESLLRTPVIVDAITSNEVENLKIDDMQSLAAVTPGLQISPSYGAVGSQVFFRGVGNGDSIIYGDQSVLLNIDGASLASGVFYRTGLFDVGQIEVLKGPQTLFFGKGSSAGIVAVTSADPTQQWETEFSTGYEFNAEELEVKGYISGPLTDKLGIRLAGYYDTMRGWAYNENPDAVGNQRLPDGQQDGGRLTLKYDDPGIGFRAKLKFAILNNNTNASSGEMDQGGCGNGKTRYKAPFRYDDCVVNQFVGGVSNFQPYRAGLDYSAFSPAFLTGSPSPWFKNGQQYQQNRATHTVLSFDYDLTPGLTLTSLTSYSQLTAAEATQSFNNAPVGGPGALFDLTGPFSQWDASQEVRLTSNWKDSWLNFMFGGLYNPSSEASEIIISLPELGVIPGLGVYSLYTDDRAQVKTNNYSGFGQVLLTPIDKWELSLGARYTSVTKTVNSISYFNNYPDFFFPGPSGQLIGTVPDDVAKVKEKDTSPEATLTYRPTSDLMAFVSYKQGYKGPAFYINTQGTTYRPGDITAHPGEKAEGFETGFKASLLDQHLALTAAAYTYKYKNLQVSFVSTINYNVYINSADARVEGLELGAVFNPPGINGLTFNAFANYNHAYYTNFTNAPCYGGQTPAEGCNPALDQQNLNGHPLSHAPLMTGNLGGEYRVAVSDRYSTSINVNTDISSRYNPVAEETPVAWQNTSVVINAALHFFRTDNKWDLALIGRDLTNKFVESGGVDDGAPALGAPADAQVYIYRPRQIMLQLTVHPEF